MITVPLKVVDYDYDYSVHGKADYHYDSSEIVDYDYTDHEKADYDYDYDYRLLAEIDYNYDYRSGVRQTSQSGVGTIFELLCPLHVENIAK